MKHFTYKQKKIKKGIQKKMDVTNLWHPNFNVLFIQANLLE